MQTSYSSLWWAIDGVLAGMGMPYVDANRRLDFGGGLRAYDDDLPLIHEAGIRAVVCLLNIPSDQKVFETAGFEFRCFPVDDGRPPAASQAREFIEFMESCYSRNMPVAVFCEAGAGRTGTMVCCYLIQRGESASLAIAHVRTREPSAVETVHQIKFLEEFERRPKS
jgi:atypical dual specificity phosphatase